VGRTSEIQRTTEESIPIPARSKNRIDLTSAKTHIVGFYSRSSRIERESQAALLNLF
jgi:hypothetical protein